MFTRFQVFETRLNVEDKLVDEFWTEWTAQRAVTRYMLENLGSIPLNEEMPWYVVRKRKVHLWGKRAK